jgi:hypothetical protein
LESCQILAVEANGSIEGPIGEFYLEKGKFFGTRGKKKNLGKGKKVLLLLERGNFGTRVIKKSATSTSERVKYWNTWKKKSVASTSERVNF